MSNKAQRVGSRGPYSTRRSRVLYGASVVGGEAVTLLMQLRPAAPDTEQAGAVYVPGATAALAPLTAAATQSWPLPISQPPPGPPLGPNCMPQVPRRPSAHFWSRDGMLPYTECFFTDKAHTVHAITNLLCFHL